MKKTQILFNYKEDNYLDYQNQIVSTQNTLATQPNNTTDTIIDNLTTINTNLILDNSNNNNIKNRRNDLYKIYNNLFIYNIKTEETITLILLDLYLNHSSFVQFNLLFFIIDKEKKVVVKNKTKEFIKDWKHMSELEDLSELEVYFKSYEKTALFLNTGLIFYKKLMVKPGKIKTYRQKFSNSLKQSKSIIKLIKSKINCINSNIKLEMIQKHINFNNNICEIDINTEIHLVIHADFVPSLQTKPKINIENLGKKFYSSISYNKNNSLSVIPIFIYPNADIQKHINFKENRDIVIYVKKNIILKSFISIWFFWKPLLNIGVDLSFDMIPHLELFEEMFTDIYSINGRGKLILFVLNELNKPITIFNCATENNSNKISIGNRIKDKYIFPKILKFSKHVSVKTGIYIYFLKPKLSNEILKLDKDYTPLKNCYIGSSINIKNRSITHNKKFKIDFILGQIYQTTDFLNKFKNLYPSYKYSKGEWALLSKLTDFYLKILEQNLLTELKPGLNNTYKATPKYFGWKKNWCFCYDTDKNYNKATTVKVFRKLNSFSTENINIFNLKKNKIINLNINPNLYEVLISEIEMSRLVDNNKCYNINVRNAWKCLDELLYIPNTAWGLIRIQNKNTLKIEYQPNLIELSKLYLDYDLRQLIKALNSNNSRNYWQRLIEEGDKTIYL